YTASLNLLCFRKILMLKLMIFLAGYEYCYTCPDEIRWYIKCPGGPRGSQYAGRFYRMIVCAGLQFGQSGKECFVSTIDQHDFPVTDNHSPFLPGRTRSVATVNSDHRQVRITAEVNHFAMA